MGRDRMVRRGRGFALVEQVGVVALIGAAAATLLPRLVDLREAAGEAALQALAGAAASALALNEAACHLGGQRPAAGGCQAVQRCEDVARLLAGDLPPGVRLRPETDGAEPGAPANGVALRCAVVLTPPGGGAAVVAGFQGRSAGL